MNGFAIHLKYKNMIGSSGFILCLYRHMYYACRKIFAMVVGLKNLIAKSMTRFANYKQLWCNEFLEY